jgi:hypothetical protein
MSARSATNGGPPVPTAATTPVPATGCLYATPMASSSLRTSALVSCSSNASSGRSWMARRTPAIHAANSSRCARRSTSSLPAPAPAEAPSHAATRTSRARVAARAGLGAGAAIGDGQQAGRARGEGAGLGGGWRPRRAQRLRCVVCVYGPVRCAAFDPFLVSGPWQPSSSAHVANVPWAGQRPRAGIQTTCCCVKESKGGGRYGYGHRVVRMRRRPSVWPDRPVVAAWRGNLATASRTVTTHESYTGRHQGAALVFVFCGSSVIGHCSCSSEWDLCTRLETSRAI